MNEKELVVQFFMEGYQNRNYDFILKCLSENYIDHSPAGARSNQEAVNILVAVSKLDCCGTESGQRFAPKSGGKIIQSAQNVCAFCPGKIGFFAIRIGGVAGKCCSCSGY